MNRVSAVGFAKGWPANEVVRLNRQEIVANRSGNSEADAVLAAAVAFPPRVGETRPIGSLLPEVLARYGLAESARVSDRESIDCLA
jgi:hypothetical protein